MMKRSVDDSLLYFRVGKERGLSKPECGGLAVVVGRSDSRVLDCRERTREGEWDGVKTGTVVCTEEEKESASSRNSRRRKERE
jgi:hypothetical protein